MIRTWFSAAMRVDFVAAAKNLQRSESNVCTSEWLTYSVDRNPRASGRAGQLIGRFGQYIEASRRQKRNSRASVRR